MSEPWYRVISAVQPLSQGDLILDCPVLMWKRLDPATITPALADRAILLREDVVVMTQACDLEHHKVHDVVLCRHIPLTAYRHNDWEPWMAARGQAPSEKAWRRFCDDIAAGYVWNLSFLDRFDHAEMGTEVRIVNFHTVIHHPARLSGRVAARPWRRSSSPLFSLSSSVLICCRSGFPARPNAAKSRAGKPDLRQIRTLPKVWSLKHGRGRVAGL